MRSKEDILKSMEAASVGKRDLDFENAHLEVLIGEVLLDIRDILAPISEIMVKRQKELMKWDKVPTDRGGKK